MAKEQIEIKREELYRQVWQRPVLHVAKDYGISDRGLKKVCQKLNVPTPPLGYWARVQYGKKVKPPTPLPKLENGHPDTHTLVSQNTDNYAELMKEISPEIISKATQINLTQTLSNPHSLVKKTMDILLQKKPDDYGVLQSNDDGVLDVRIGPENLKRALKIMDSLIKFFESIGYQVSAKSTSYGRNTYVAIDDINVLFSMNEAVRSTSRQYNLSEYQKRFLKNYPIRYGSYKGIPSNKLKLRFYYGEQTTIQKQWVDRELSRL